MMINDCYGYVVAVGLICELRLVIWQVLGSPASVRLAVDFGEVSP